MNKTEKLFEEIAATLPEAKKSRMFGATCIKAPNGKAVLMVYGDAMVFKLTDNELKEALSLDGAKLFEPMQAWPMGGWVQLPDQYADKWPHYAQKAMEYVKTIKK